MGDIIDVEYKEIVELEDKTNEELCQEVNLYWNQMEALGRLGFEFAARAGQRLNVIKSRLKHGEWEDWCKDNLYFSKSKAEKMMKLASKMNDENSLFFKNVNFTDIGISKVWALLSAPEEVAEKVIENPEMPDMSVRELKDEIKRLKEAKGELEEELAACEDTWQTDKNVLELEIETLKGELRNQPAADPAVLAEKEAELQKMQDKLAKEKEKSKKLKEFVDAEKEKAVAEAQAKAEEAAKTKVSEDLRLLQESNQQAAEEIDRLTRKLANNSNTEVATFKAYADQLQKAFGSCMESVASMESENTEQAEKMRYALKQIMTQMIERI